MSIIMRKYGFEFITTVSRVYLQYELGILWGLGLHQKQFKPRLHNNINH